MAKHVQESSQEDLQVCAARLERLKHNSSAFFEAHVKPNFVGTKLMVKAQKTLEETGSVVLTGNPGEGKTLTGIALLSKYSHRRCLVLADAKDWDAVDVENVDAVFIDDVFGKFYLDHGRLAEWKPVFHKMDGLVTNRDIKVIISTRKDILKKVISNLKCFKVYKNITDLSAENLSQGETVAIFDSIAKGFNRSIPQQNIGNYVKMSTSSNIGLPLCCHLFCSKNELFLLGDDFFKEPCAHLEKDIIASKRNFATLVFLFLNGGEMSFSRLTTKDKHTETSQRITQALKLTAKPPRIESTAAILDELTGIYTKQTETSYMFIHNSIYETVGHLYWKESPDDVIRFCSGDFLHQCLVVTNADRNRGKLYVKENCFEEMAIRLIKEAITSRQLLRLVKFEGLSFQPFADVFVQCLSKAEEAASFCRIRDEAGHSFLSSLTRFPAEGTFYLFLQLLDNVYVCSNKKDKQCACAVCLQKTLAVDSFCESGNGRLMFLTVLLDSGARPRAKSLPKAVLGGNVDVVETIIQSLKDNGLWKEDDTEIQAAYSLAERESKEEVKSLLKTQRSVSVKGDAGDKFTPK